MDEARCVGLLSALSTDFMSLYYVEIMCMAIHAFRKGFSIVFSLVFFFCLSVPVVFGVAYEMNAFIARNRKCPQGSNG